MKQKVINARKARTRCPAISFSFVHQAPVYLRRQFGHWGADWQQFNDKHGLMQMPGHPQIIPGV